MFKVAIIFFPPDRAWYLYRGKPIPRYPEKTVATTEGIPLDVEKANTDTIFPRNVAYCGAFRTTFFSMVPLLYVRGFTKFRKRKAHYIEQLFQISNFKFEKDDLPGHQCSAIAVGFHGAYGDFNINAALPVALYYAAATNGPDLQYVNISKGGSH